MGEAVDLTIGRCSKTTSAAGPMRWDGWVGSGAGMQRDRGDKRRKMPRCAKSTVLERWLNAERSID